MVSPTIRSPRVGVAPAYQATGRKARRPQHRFNLINKPYQIQPFCIAPVIPGESLKSAMLQAQLWSDPLASGMKNIGWWNEYWLFYVKHRDLLGFETATDGLGKDLIDMFVTNESIAGHQDADGAVDTYCPPKGVDFTRECLRRIVEEYFRDEGETFGGFTIDNLPIAQIYGKGQSDWSEKLTLAADYEDRRTDVDIDGDGTIYMNELELAWQEWAAMREAGLIEMDYDDWMRTYGSQSTIPNTDRVDHHRPELLAHSREFSYPTNTVEPTTGAPSTAIGFRTGKRLGKAFFFPEPGWIIGLTCIRPKVYLGNQQGSVVSMMQTRDSWLPAILNNQMSVSHLLIAADAGPLEAIMTTGYYVDLRDLLNYGDQFVNYTIPSTPPVGFVELPLSTGARRYPANTEVMAMFSNTTTGRIRQDGVLSLMIMGRQQERTRNLVLGQA